MTTQSSKAVFKKLDALPKYIQTRNGNNFIIASGGFEG